MSTASTGAPLDPVLGPGGQREATHHEAHAACWVVSKSFISDPGISCLLSASMKLWQAVSQTLHGSSHPSVGTCLSFTGFLPPSSSLSGPSFQPVCLCWHVRGELSAGAAGLWVTEGVGQISIH